MKQFFTITFLILSFNFLSNAQNDNCTVSISSTDTLICGGGSPTLTATTFGPDVQLMASNTAGNNHRGNMFDIVATNSVSILSFDAFPMGSTTIEVYYKVGTWNGFANTPSAWTLIGSAPVVYTGGFVPVAVPVNVMIPAGQTYGFYVTSSNTSVSLNYSNGTSVGNVYSSDANISFLEGGGMEYPFTLGTGAVYQPRVWNGNIHYALANAATTYTWGGGEITSSITQAVNSPTIFTVESTIPGCPTLYDTLQILSSIPSVDAGNDFAVCMGSEATLAGTGALASVTWDNSVTDGVAFVPTNPATYIVTGIDSVGCDAHDTVFVDVYLLPIVSAGSDQTICSGDEVTFEGQGAVTYTWDNGIVDGVPFTPGAGYTAIVTGVDGNGCSNTDTTVLVVNALPLVSAGSDQTICLAEFVSLNGTGADAYMWTMGITNNVPFLPTSDAQYIVTGFDVNGCQAADTVNVYVHGVYPTISLSGGTLQCDQSGGVSYQWINCSNNQPVSGATNQIFSPSQSGTYAVIMSDNMCSGISSCLVYSNVGVSENSLDEEITVYPNPNNGQFTIINSLSVQLNITDLSGREVKQLSLEAGSTTLDLTNEESGVYFVKISKEGESITKKVIIDRK